MCRHLLVELIAEHDRVLELPGERKRVADTLIPELRFSEEVEPGPLNHPSLSIQSIRAEEDRGSEDALEGGNQAAIPCRRCAGRKWRASRRRFRTAPPATC